MQQLIVVENNFRLPNVESPASDQIKRSACNTHGVCGSAAGSRCFATISPHENRAAPRVASRTALGVRVEPRRATLTESHAT